MIARKFVLEFLVWVAGSLPIIMYGLISISQGWYFLPNSILLKGNIPVLTLGAIPGFLGRLPINLLDAPHILMLVIACLIVYLWCEDRKFIGKKERYLAAIFIMTTLLHMQIANIGWYYRYEAYLIMAGCV